MARQDSSSIKNSFSRSGIVSGPSRAEGKTRRGKETPRHERSLLDSRRVPMISGGTSRGSTYVKPMSGCCKCTDSSPDSPSATIETSSLDNTPTRPRKLSPQPNRELAQRICLSPARHLSKRRKTSSAFISISSPSTNPLLRFVSAQLDASTQARDEAAILRARCQQPLQALPATMNARARNYNARNAKRKPLSNSSASSRKRSSGV